MTILLRGYQAAGTLARPALRRWVRRRLVQGKEVAGRVGERFGIPSLPRPTGRLIWVHAASAGETISVLPMIASLASSCTILLTTGTATSAALAAARLPAGALHQFVPLDVPGWVAAFLDHWRPDAAVFVESEIWPAMLAALDARGLPRMLVNARLSARSAARWARAPHLAMRLLGGFRYIHAQSAADADNLRHLGLSDILLWGNLKFAAPALPVDQATLAALRRQVPGPVWLAASTHPGEEQLVIAAHQTLAARFSGLVTVIAPRHPERGAEIAALAAVGGRAAPRRAAGEAPVAGQVYVADTLGELGLLFRLVRFALIGGSLVDHGGHNVIEPARLGLAVLCGPFTRNFVEPVAMLAAAGALRQVADAAALAAAAGAWLENPEAAAEAGARGRVLFDGCAELPGRLAALALEISL